MTASWDDRDEAPDPAGFAEFTRREAEARERKKLEVSAAWVQAAKRLGFPLGEPQRHVLLDGAALTSTRATLWVQGQKAPTRFPGVADFSEPVQVTGYIVGRYFLVHRCHISRYSSNSWVISHVPTGLLIAQTEIRNQATENQHHVHLGVFRTMRDATKVARELPPVLTEESFGCRNHAGVPDWSPDCGRGLDEILEILRAHEQLMIATS